MITGLFLFRYSGGIRLSSPFDLEMNGKRERNVYRFTILHARFFKLKNLDSVNGSLIKRRKSTVGHDLDILYSTFGCNNKVQNDF